MSETFGPGGSPRGDQGLDAIYEAFDVSDATPAPRSGDKDIQAVLDQIEARQKAQQEKIRGLTYGDLAFALMRQVPREHWNTPLSKLGHWPRGSSIKEIKETPALLNYTTAQAILQLFELDDKARARE